MAMNVGYRDRKRKRDKNRDRNRGGPREVVLAGGGWGPNRGQEVTLAGGGWGGGQGGPGPGGNWNGPGWGGGQGGGSGGGGGNGTGPGDPNSPARQAGLAEEYNFYSQTQGGTLPFELWNMQRNAQTPEEVAAFHAAVQAAIAAGTWTPRPPLPANGYASGGLNQIASEGGRSLLYGGAYAGGSGTTPAGYTPPVDPNAPKVVTTPVGSSQYAPGSGAVTTQPPSSSPLFMTGTSQSTYVPPPPATMASGPGPAPTTGATGMPSNSLMSSVMNNAIAPAGAMPRRTLAAGARPTSAWQQAPMPRKRLRRPMGGRY